MNSIILNEAEQRLSKFIARKRYSNARARGIPDKKVGPLSNEEIDLQGIGAEIAFCKAVNLYPDLDTDNYPLPEEDAITRNGTRIDIKSTKYKNGHLVAVLGKKDKQADLYALVIGTFPRYHIAGYSTADKLFKEENIKSFGYKNNYVLSQEELNCF